MTEAVRRHPYSVILLDEVEKAHKDVWNIFLQILDEGRITDGKGRVVNMKNTIIIMTSNIGSHLITDETNSKDREILIKNEIKKYFRPEFLNRIDDIVVYENLTPQNIESITTLLFQDLSKRIAEKGIQITWDDHIIEKISSLGYDRELGARPLKRAVIEYIVNPLSEKIISGEVVSGDRIFLDLDGENHLTLKK